MKTNDSCEGSNGLAIILSLTLSIALLNVSARAAHAEEDAPPESSLQTTKPPADLAAHVKNALHADPYFYDRHVLVSVEDGDVILNGFVFSEWDLRNAIRIATQAAEGRKVIDNLTIKEGGRK